MKRIEAFKLYDGARLGSGLIWWLMGRRAPKERRAWKLIRKLRDER